MRELDGFAHAWEEFSKLDPVEACRRADVAFDRNIHVYTIKSFGHDVFISSERQDVFCDSSEGKFLLALREYFFGLSLLWYLITAKDIPLSGNLVKPSAVPGGQIFVKGTHVLPLDEIARKFNNRKEQFLAAGNRFGAVEADYGDAALKLLPFPRVPVFLILWFGDEEFPARAQLLIDSTCSEHLSTDVVWAITMICCLIFLDGT